MRAGVRRILKQRGALFARRTSIPRRRHARMEANQSISRSRPSATRATFRSTARTASFAAKSSQTPPSMMARVCAKVWSRRRIPGVGSGQIPPIDLPRTKRGSQPTAWSARSTARNRAAAPCQSDHPRPMAGSRLSGQRSSMSSDTRRIAWGWSSGPSA